MRQVAIVDDSEDVRSLWRAELERDQGFGVCAEGSDGWAAVEIARLYRPDVMLLDLAMPGGGGLEALPLILAASPETRVVVLSGFGRREFARTAGALGACGFLEKHLGAGSLPSRLREVLGDASAEGADGPLVLVIDPDRDDQDLARHLLIWLGYRADAVDDGDAALTVIGSRRYAAVLIADRPPGLLAADVAAELHHRTGPDDPVPMLVMSRDPEHGRTAWLAAGLTDHLSLPLLSSDLGEALARHAPLPGLDHSNRSDGGPADVDVDVEALAILVGQIGPAALASILEGFRVQTEDRLAHLRAAISTGDAEEVSRLAHTIAGAAASVGAVSLQTIGRELEVLAATGSLDGSRDRANLLHAAFTRTTEVLATKAYLPGPRDGFEARKEVGRKSLLRRNRGG